MRSYANMRFQFVRQTQIENIKHILDVANSYFCAECSTKTYVMSEFLRHGLYLDF